VIGTEVAVPLAKLIPPICVAGCIPKPVAPTICVPWSEILPPSAQDLGFRCGINTAFIPEAVVASSDPTPIRTRGNP